MGEWKITYTTESGFEGEEIICAVNKMMAWEMFEEIAAGYEEKVISADCVRVIEEG